MGSSKACRDSRYASAKLVSIEPNLREGGLTQFLLRDIRLRLLRTLPRFILAHLLPLLLFVQGLPEPGFVNIHQLIGIGPFGVVCRLSAPFILSRSVFRIFNRLDEPAFGGRGVCFFGKRLAG